MNLPIENQVSNLKLSKKLEELGVPQDSIWMWVKFEFWNEPKLMLSDLCKDIEMMYLSDKREYAYSAYTCAELGEMLPIGYYFRKINQGWLPSKYGMNELLKEWLELLSKTETNARTKMIIYLIENDLIKI